MSRNPHVVAWLMTLVLCVKLLVPGGYMPVAADGRIMVAICTGTAPATMTQMPMPMATAMPGMMHHENDGSADHRKAQMPCAFAGLSSAAMGTIDAVMLAGAIAYVLALGFAAVFSPPRTAPAHLRPPLRGPPAIA